LVLVLVLVLVLALALALVSVSVLVSVLASASVFLFPSRSVLGWECPFRWSPAASLLWLDQGTPYLMTHSVQYIRQSLRFLQQ
jgi:hypothetical protein